MTSCWRWKQRSLSKLDVEEGAWTFAYFNTTITGPASDLRRVLSTNPRAAGSAPRSFGIAPRPHAIMELPFLAQGELFLGRQENV